MPRTHRKAVLVAVAGAAALLLAGCGGSPAAPSGDGPADEELTPAMEVYQEFEAMEPGDERTEKLIEAAKAEGGVSISAAASSIEPLSAAFEEEFGIPVTVVQDTSSETQRTRALQEHQAGKSSSDVIFTYASDLSHIMIPEGVTVEFKHAMWDDVPERARSERWIAAYEYPVVTQWNPEKVSEDEVPEDWTDLADPKWAGRLGLVAGDGSWYYTLYKYYTEEEGMSDEEFEETWRAIAKNSRVFEGHGSPAGLVTSGEIDLLVNGFQLFTTKLQAEGSAIESKPYTSPIVTLMYGSGLVSTAEHPAAAILFSEWVLGDGQKVLTANYNYPLNIEAAGGIDYSVEDEQLIPEPVDSTDNETFEEWQTAFDNLTRGTGDIIP